MKTLSELEKLNEIYEEESRLQEILEKRQIEYLQSLRATNKETIEWFLNKGFYFKHPTIQRVTGMGPILHEDEKYLYYWSGDKGILKHDLYTAETKHSNLLQLIQANGFINAVQGLQYVNMTLEDHVKDIQDRNTLMKKELDSVLTK